jgi:HlyD family secretion protein
MTGRPDGTAIVAQAKARRRRAKIYQIAGAVAVVAAVVIFFVWRAKGSGKEPVRFVTTAVRTGDLKEVVSATGTLKGLGSVDVGAQISGRVLKVNVDFNDAVTTGEVLAEIDPAQLVSRIEQSKAQVQAADASLTLAKATLVQAKAQLQRANDLGDKGLMSSKDVEAARADADRAVASVASSSAQTILARASLKDAETQLTYAIIRSPIDGIVLSRVVEPGQTVAASLQSPILFTLAKDLTQLRLYVDIDEADVGKVKEQQPATFLVDAWTDHSFPSSVLSVHNLATAGQTVVTYQAVLAVENADMRLRPGMTATATIITAEHKGVLLVPNAALRFTPPATAKSSAAGLPFMGSVPRTPGMGGPAGGGGAKTRVKPLGEAQGIVYVLKEGKPARTVIGVGGTDGERTEVKTGLAAGAQVITDVDERPAK